MAGVDRHLKEMGAAVDPDRLMGEETALLDREDRRRLGEGRADQETGGVAGIVGGLVGDDVDGPTLAREDHLVAVASPGPDRGLAAAVAVDLGDHGVLAGALGVEGAADGVGAGGGGAGVDLGRLAVPVVVVVAARRAGLGVGPADPLEAGRDLRSCDGFAVVVDHREGGLDSAVG